MYGVLLHDPLEYIDVELPHDYISVPYGTYNLMVGILDKVPMELL